MFRDIHYEFFPDTSGTRNKYEVYHHCGANYFQIIQCLQETSKSPMLFMYHTNLSNVCSVGFPRVDVMEFSLLLEEWCVCPVVVRISLLVSLKVLCY